MTLAVEMRLLFSILVLHVAAMIYAQDDQLGFISIDCGGKLNYTQEGLTYFSDDGFIESGVSHDLSHIHRYPSLVYNSLRSFPGNENKRNCYTLRPKKNKKYLIRAMFFYGNYSSGQPPIFDLYLGTDYWGTVNISDPTKYLALEIIHLTSSDYTHVCLLNTDQGDPFITSLELRLLDNTMYYKDQSRSLILVSRVNLGSTETVRYVDDKYDRIWLAETCCKVLQSSDSVSLGPNNEEHVPSKVMSTAITPRNSTYELYYRWNTMTNDEIIIYIHLAEVETLKSNQKREFKININGTLIGTFSPSTNITTIRNEMAGGISRYELTATRTLSSTLPPILNALEIYTSKQLLQNQTHDQDAAAMWSTKSIYGLIKLNWQGDPCVPQAWVGLRCNYDAPSEAKIISVNLSSRGLSGEIAPALANLTMIDSLDLSYNNLTGNVPDFLAKLDNLKILNLTGNNFTRPLPAELLRKSKKGSLLLSIEESSTEDKHKISSLLIAALAIALVVLVLSLFAIVWVVRKKALIKTKGGLTPRKQQYTYSEVVTITNNFQKEIGRGGFGSVFHGSIGDNQVAVKMLSESSSQGYKEFEAEVKLLMEIHHTNITSLVGYCDQNNHKAIIYDFMANGNLGKHLFDGSPNVLSWERRIQIGCDAAEGLAYMHHGCRPPIVHRDVKSANILLTEGFQAKLADFGLSRAYPTEDATDVSSLKVAGTIGYLDPEYHSTNRLTEKTDVYSFGIVLLELITGRRAISDATNIVQWVKSPFKEGNIESIIDSRLDGRFDINTAWKVAETAMACVSHPSIERPTMSDVVVDLKQCLQIVKTHQTEPVSLNLESTSDIQPR